MAWGDLVSLFLEREERREDYLVVSKESSQAWGFAQQKSLVKRKKKKQLANNPLSKIAAIEHTLQLKSERDLSQLKWELLVLSLIYNA